MSFVGGKLKLKGGEPLKASGGVKKKKKKAEEKGLVSASSLPGEQGDKAEEDPQEKTRKAIHGYELNPDAVEDRRTEAEKKWEKRHKQLEEQNLKKQAQKSHRDRVKEFNEYLANLSEHHDIPKVGPG